MKVQRIEFSVLSPETIKAMAVAKITRTELYDEEGYPIEGGLMDPRLGVVDPGVRCRTCGCSVGDCFGHFGYLDLTRPVIHVHYIKFIYSLLKMICHKCSRALFEEGAVDKNRRYSLKDLAKMIKKKCPHCNVEQKKLKLIKPYSFVENSDVLTPVKIRERFEKIPDDDLRVMGFRNMRPEWLVITLLPIPPVTVRPSITLETGERSEDDLTHKLVDIVRINDRLRENIDLGAPDFIIEDLWELMQYHVSTYFDNEISGVPPARHRSGRLLKTLSQRLKTKEGRFRGNLAGKRVNFSARTVISPDPMIGIDEVGVPQVVAVELTVPLRVNESNIEEAKSLVLNGPSVWPGANYVIKSDGRRKKITPQNKEEIVKELVAGYIVERHLKDGDMVLFNRQPSLHRMSIMCHRVRVMTDKTFRMNLCVTIPYNADFDGDEMNLHVPQTEESQVEAENLMAVQKNMRSPRFSAPIIAAKIDHVTGLYLLTSGDRKFTRDQFTQIVRAVNQDIELPDKETMSGKEIFSLFLPKDLSMEYKSKSGDTVVIKNGKLLEGVIDKMSVGAEAGKLLDKIEMEFGSHVAKKFLFDITTLAVKILTQFGFSISISDQDLPEAAKMEVRKLLDQIKRDVNQMIEQYNRGELKVLIGRTPKESLEHAIKITLRNGLNSAEKILASHMKENPTLIMAKSGARGDLVNIVQTAVMVGQEMTMGERIERGYHGRVFPHFKVDDINLEAKGFVSRGFKDGLTPFEFFFDAINSRESLMDKSLKTRHSGYMERRLVGALQDLKVEYDGTVRDSDNRIVQFVPGEDGIDPSKNEREGVSVRRIADKLFG
jgi:DNA-directed RNA polymerase subunit A'